MAGRSSTTTPRPMRASLLVLAALAAACAREKDRIALVGGNIIDGSGGSVLRDGVIVIYQGKVGNRLPRARDSRFPRVRNRSTSAGNGSSPGLIDSHVHSSRWSLPPIPGLRDHHRPRRAR